MSLGLSFLRACLEQGDLKLVRRASPTLFLEDELPAFKYIRTYYDTYSALPTVGVLRQNGHDLPKLRQPAATGYYYDRLRKRAAYSEVNERHPRLVDAMRTQNVVEIATVLREMVQATVGVTEDGNNYSTMADQMVTLREDYEEARANPGLRGITTGWPTLDALTNGLEEGDILVIAGRPSMGKSYLLMEMAYAAHLAGHPIAFTSMEMTNEQMARRWVGRATGINPRLIRSGELGSYANSRFYEAVAGIEGGGAPVHLLAGNMRKGTAAVEEMLMEFNPAVMYVDSAYLLSPSVRAERGRMAKWESITEVIEELKAMALRHRARLAISVQFNRTRKSDTTREADMTEIGGSDAIPQAASIVLGARRGPNPFQRTQRTVDVMKNRDGEVGKFATAFLFSPLRMGEVPLIEEDIEEDGEGSTLDVSWML